MITGRTSQVLTAVAVVLGLLLVGWLVRPGVQVAGDLATAVEDGDHRLARLVLATGAPPDEPRVLGMTPLMRATIRDDAEMVQLLLDAGADLAATTRDGSTPAHLAAQFNSHQSLQILLGAGADPDTRTRAGLEVLHTAAASNSADAIAVLADAGVDLEGPSGMTTQGVGHPRDHGATALGVAAYRRQFAAVRSLLDLGAHVDARSTTGHTALQLAVFGGAGADVVQALLDAGADTAAIAHCNRGCMDEPWPTSTTPRPCCGGGDVLEWARRLGRFSLVGLLADRTGADQGQASGEQAHDGEAESLADAVGAGDFDRAAALLADGAHPDRPRVLNLTPLMRAAARDDAAIVTLLLDAGATRDATTRDGLTAAHVAAQQDAVDALEVLLDRGINPDARTRNGLDVLGWAALADSPGAIGLLADRGVALDRPSQAVAQGHGRPRDRGATALGVAARADNLAAVDALLGHGAAVDAPSTSGHTPLLLAVFEGASPEVVARLLDADADPTVTVDCDEACSVPGGDAAHWARQLDREDLLPLLSD